MRRLITIVDDPEAPYAAQIAAAVHVLDRAFGRPKQAVDIETTGKTLEQLLEAVYEARRAEAKTIDEPSASEPPENTVTNVVR